MTIVVFGSTGMVGSELTKQLQPLGHEVIQPNRKVFEMVNPYNFEFDGNFIDTYRRLGVTHIVNCIAYTDVGGAEKNVEECYRANSDIPLYLTNLAIELNIPIIHISSDFVYQSGSKIWNGMGWSADEFLQEHRLLEYRPTYMGHYANSKQRAEEYVSLWDKHYIIRTSWLFGGNKNTYLDFAFEDKPILPDIYQNSYGTPTYVPDLVDAIVAFIEKEPEFGVYNFANKIDKPITKQEAISRANKAINNTLTGVLSFEYFKCLPGAPRPFNSALDITKFTRALYTPPTFEEAVGRYAKRILQS